MGLYLRIKINVLKEMKLKYFLYLYMEKTSD